MKRITAIVMALFVICGLLSAVYAADGDEDVDIQTSVVATETVAATEEPITETISATETEPDTESDLPQLSPEEGRELTWGEKIEAWIGKHSTRILAGLSALGWLLSYISQRVSLFPKCKSTNESVTSAIAEIEDFKDDMKNKVTNIEDEVKKALHIVQGAIERIDKLQKAQVVNEKDREILQNVLTEQSKMLNTVIQASTLAQWRKDEIGHSYENNQRTIAGMFEEKGVIEERVACD